MVDGQGRRVGKQVNGALVQAFVYQDNLKPIAELDGNGNVVSRFVYATHATLPDYMLKSGTAYRLITDQVGSVRLVVDATSGNVVQRLDYDSFGNVLTDTNPGFQPFGFAGGLYDRDTGLVHFLTRDYDPQTGRWTTRDPIGFRGGSTYLYQYRLADPVNGNDPTGLDGANAGGFSFSPSVNGTQTGYTLNFPNGGPGFQFQSDLPTVLPTPWAPNTNTNFQTLLNCMTLDNGWTLGAFAQTPPNLSSLTLGAQAQNGPWTLQLQTQTSNAQTQFQVNWGSGDGPQITLQATYTPGPAGGTTLVQGGLFFRW